MDDFAKLLVQTAGALAIALLSAWITVQLSLKRFRTERLWDRKVQAYERLIDAFHKAKKFSTEHMDADMRGRDLPDERNKELQKLAHEAQEEILRMADIGSFTLSQEALEIVAKYQMESNDDHITSWSQHLEHHYAVASKHMNLLIQEAKRDLAG